MKAEDFLKAYKMFQQEFMFQWATLTDGTACMKVTHLPTRQQVSFKISNSDLFNTCAFGNKISGLIGYKLPKLTHDQLISLLVDLCNNAPSEVTK